MTPRDRISLIIRETLDEMGVELPWYETDKVAEVLVNSPFLIISAVDKP